MQDNLRSFHDKQRTSCKLHDAIRAVLLHLEREIQASKKDLALLDAQSAGSGSATASGDSQL
jgi:hypothetical protein